jgi:hypothetical protein
MAATTAILDLGFRRLEDKRLGRLIRFFCGLVGVTRGRFLDDQLRRSSKMATTVAIGFPSFFWPTPGSTGPVFWGLIVADWRKVPFNDHLCYSSKMATTRLPSWIWFLSIDDKCLGHSSDFSVAYWGWLVEGSFRWSATPLIQHCRYGSHLGFGFRRLSDECLSTGPIFWCLIGDHQSSPCSTSP